MRPGFVSSSGGLGRPLARRMNAEVPEEVARWCAANRARLVHVSTDLVFGAASPPAGGFAEDAAAGPLSVYGATKHAVLGFTISLAGDLDRAALPIKVSAVCPDGIDTDMVRNVRGSKEAGIVFAALKLLTVEEVAGAVLDLVDKPRLAVAVPWSRGVLAHALRPFPELSLKALKPKHQ